MPDTLKVDNEKEIIEIRSYGTLTKVDMEKSIEGLMELKRKHGIDKVLIDTTKLDSVPNTIEIFETMANFPHGFKVAIIIDKNKAIASDIRFGETVAMNRGKNIKVFSNNSSAINWLENHDNT